MIDTFRCIYCHNDILLAVADRHTIGCRLRTCGPEDDPESRMTPEEAREALEIQAEEHERMMAEPCEHCGIRPKEVDLDVDHWDIYCTECINSGAV